MQNYISVVAATAVVGYDLLSTYEEVRTRNYARRLVAIGAAGSAAAGDCLFDILVNGVKVGDGVNLALGVPTKDHLLPQNIRVPANALLQIKITDAATTNPINLLLVFIP